MEVYDFENLFQTLSFILSEMYFNESSKAPKSLNLEVDFILFFLLTCRPHFISYLNVIFL